jgi:hypothetical protein
MALDLMERLKISEGRTQPIGADSENVVSWLLELVSNKSAGWAGIAFIYIYDINFSYSFGKIIPKILFPPSFSSNQLLMERLKISEGRTQPIGADSENVVSWLLENEGGKRISDSVLDQAN